MRVQTASSSSMAIVTRENRRRFLSIIYECLPKTKQVCTEGELICGTHCVSACTRSMDLGLSSSNPISSSDKSFRAEGVDLSTCSIGVLFRGRTIPTQKSFPAKSNSCASSVFGPIKLFFLYACCAFFNRIGKKLF